MGPRLGVGGVGGWGGGGGSNEIIYSSISRKKYILHKFVSSVCHFSNIFRIHLTS